jgi:hypothetical protein
MAKCDIIERGSTMKKLPIGIQDYKKLIEGGHVYVDKTKWIYEMASSGTPFFISRPRRFGKSLTVSALYYLFKGEKELFKDTWIYDKWEFKEYPVIKISMVDIDATSEETIEETLKEKLKEIYSDYNITPHSTNLKMMFSGLIRELAKKEKVALLIDEYEKPILDHLQDKETAEAIRSLLRNFYIVMKESDQYLKFVFMTGITKFTKTGVFSALNNLRELTISGNYSTMFGYTEEELRAYFKEYIEKGANQFKISQDELLAKIKEYYNGFSFDGEHFVYNPFSILNYFAEYSFENYWMNSGSPSFIIDYAKAHALHPEGYLQTYIRESKLTSYEIEAAPPESFLVQSGYLTFKEKHETLGYLLDYPNKEVRDSFSELVLLGTYNMSEMTESNIVTEIIMGLEEHDFSRVFEQMNRVIAAIPFNLHDKKESYYHSVTLTLFWACGLNVSAEERTSRGMADLVLNYHGDIDIIEFKKDKATVALEQIKAKGYGKKYGAATLIGIEIDAEARHFRDYVLEKVL